MRRRRYGLGMCVACMAAGLAAIGATPPGSGEPRDVVWEKELVITDRTVVNDERAKTGAWSFGHLMNEMAGEKDTKEFILHWLGEWEEDQVINTFEVPARPNIREVVIDPWKKADGHVDRDGNVLDDESWDMKLDNAPFRLLAITNRLDLHLSTTAGPEGRFVYGVVDPTDPEKEPELFTVIFEYALPLNDLTLEDWAAEWHALGDLDFGNDYNAALEKVTNRFVERAAEDRSHIAQVRTNEIALGSQWELREFVIDDDGALSMTDVKQTLDKDKFQDKQAVADYINRNEMELLAGTHIVPLQTAEDGPARAGAAPVPFQFFWKAEGINNNVARRNLSMQSCNGCHHREAGAMNFLHIAPRKLDDTAQLSGFMTGTTVKDPVSGDDVQFNDIHVRSRELKKLLGLPVPELEMFVQKQNLTTRVH